MATLLAAADEPSGPVPGRTLSLQQAIDAATPGTIIQLLPGRYTSKVQIRRRHGRDGAPIVIQGAGRRTVIDGQVDPVGRASDSAGRWPFNGRARVSLQFHRRRKAPFFRVVDSSWIEWRDLFVENCWPYVFHVQGSHHLTVAGCDVVGATVVFYMKDQGRRRPSHHMLLEDNRWCQDPTGPADPGSADPAGRLSWQDWTWHEMKSPDPALGDRDLRFMNGAFVGGSDMAGGIILRRNRLRFAFNAIRLEVEEDQSRREPLRPGDSGPDLDLGNSTFNYTPPDLTRNCNVEIYDNEFAYIRDNAVEPEYGSTNWWIWNNRLLNVHKAMSIHNNGGGFWYFFGNVGSTEAVPPAQLNEPPARWRGKPGPRKLGGGIFKFYYGPPMPTRPCFAFHNSWRPRGSVVSGGEMRHFAHLGNAVEHCAPADPRADLRCPASPRFADDHRYVAVTRIPPQPPDGLNRFDHDVADAGDFPDAARAEGHEMQGRKATGPVFDPAGRDGFALAVGSPARGLAPPIVLRGGVDWPAAEDWTSAAAPDAGAMQPGGRFVGPAFAHLANPHYEEAPRLVRVEASAAAVVLTFSVPLDPLTGPPTAMVAVEADDGRLLHPVSWAVEGRRLRLTLEAPVAAVAALTLARDLTGGLDGGGLPVTGWGAVLPLTIV